MTDLEEIPNDDTTPQLEPSYWSEDGQYPLKDWQHAVLEDCTRMGYWQWVEMQRDLRGDDL